MSELKHILKNEYVRSLILLVIILVSIVAFWFGLRTYLRTGYPLLAVASGSMIPTLNVGDLIIIQGGLGGNDIVAENDMGDIIVFHKPNNPDDLIVHRAVEIKFINGTYYLTTKGDANDRSCSWETDFSVGYVEGKVIWVIPYLGHIPLFVRTPKGMLIIVIFIVILVLLEFIIPLAKEKKSPEQPKEENDVSDMNSL